MVVNRLQNGLLNSRIALRLNCQKKIQMGTHTFFSNSERDFYSDNLIHTLKIP
jgi:hypothetical protein